MGICLSFGKHRKKIVGLSLFSLLFFYYSSLYAAQVTLAWDPSDSDVEGYNLYMRVEGNTYDYTSPAWSGDSTTCTIDQLDDGTYYFVARAYAASDESIDSNEVEYKVIINSEPVAEAGTDQDVSTGTQVTLDGSGSTDSDGTIAGYQWTQTSGPSVSLSSSTSSQAIFTAPSVNESTALSFQLAVTDNGGLTNSDTCQVTVLPVAPTDSDNDGISDIDETDIYGTDPYNADTDGDGISDGQEVSDSTDPTINNATVIYEDAEDGMTTGWEVYDNTPAGASVANVYDADRQSSVIELTGEGLQNGFRLRNADGSGWQNSTDFVIQWGMKYSENFRVYIDVETTAGHRYIQYDTADEDILGDGEYVKYGLGSDSIDGQWHKYSRDLQADLQNAQPGVQILYVNAFLIRGSGQVDDIKLLATMPEDSIESGTIYEDAEDGLTTGWAVYDNTPAGASITNVYDADRQSSVIELTGEGLQNGFRLRNADGSSWQNSTNFVIQWSVKYSENFRVFIDVETTDGQRYIQYESIDEDKLGDGKYVVYGLGSDATDGQWHMYSRDLQADLQNAQPGVEVLSVNSFLIRGSGQVDDIKLLATMPEDSIESGTIYEDAEDGMTTGWEVYDNTPASASIANAYDADCQSSVIELSGEGLQNGFRLRNADGSSWQNSTDFVIQWSMKCSEKFIVYIDVETTAGHRYIQYSPVDEDKLGDGEYVHYGLGSDAMDGQWVTFICDLQAELSEAQPGVKITEVNGFLVRGSGRIDEIRLF